MVGGDHVRFEGLGSGVDERSGTDVVAALVADKDVHGDTGCFGGVIRVAGDVELASPNTVVLEVGMRMRQGEQRDPMVAQGVDPEGRCGVAGRIGNAVGGVILHHGSIALDRRGPELACGKGTMAGVGPGYPGLAWSGGLGERIDPDLAARDGEAGEMDADLRSTGRLDQEAECVAAVYQEAAGAGRGKETGRRTPTCRAPWRGFREASSADNGARRSAGRVSLSSE